LLEKKGGSALSQKERKDEFKQIAQGECRVQQEASSEGFVEKERKGTVKKRKEISKHNHLEKSDTGRRTLSHMPGVDYARF